MDEDAVRRRCREYRAALPSSTVAYAGKAFLTQAMASWVAEEGLSLDVCSGGELALARSVGFPLARIIFHGNAKTPAELREAVGVGRIVIDNVAEIHRLAALAPLAERQDVYLRVTPGVEAGAHAAIRTGSETQKFGIPWPSSPARWRGCSAGRSCDWPGCTATSAHRSHRCRPSRRRPGSWSTSSAMVRERFATTLPELDLGGGHGVAYLDDDHGLDLGHFAAAVPKVVAERCRALGCRAPGWCSSRTGDRGRGRGDALPRDLGQTAGRADLRRGRRRHERQPQARALRRAVRGDRARPVRGPVTIVGRHCEAGDVIAEDVPAGDVRPGDLVVVRVTGAYHHAMGSSYNLTCRPPVVAVSGGVPRLIVRREEPWSCCGVRSGADMRNAAPA